MSKYLYGAAVQGIQDFIFKTNELKHIVGASELVEQICTSAFDKLLEDVGVETGESVVRAAGNIKFIFDQVEDCQKVVRAFPKRVMTMAPGITISQAVVTLDNDFAKAIDDIEALLKEQRNKPSRNVTSGLIGIKRSNNTGLPVTNIKKGVFQDDSTIQKEAYQDTKGLCEKSFGTGKLLAKRPAYDISDITDKNDWIAIIHADGNGLGKVVQAIGKQKDYANAFISAFEEQTKAHLGDILREQHVFADDKDCLTACAGIAFIKSSYPFYYGYQLAEDLCGQAKKDTKSIHGAETNHLPPSCLMFHKVQDSFIVDYKDIERRELTTKDGLSFKAGPYYIHPQDSKNTVEDLAKASELLSSDNGDGIKSGIRNWVSLRIEDKNKAEQRKNRMLDIFAEGSVIKTLTCEDGNRCIAYDVLAYHTIMNQETNE